MISKKLFSKNYILTFIFFLLICWLVFFVVTYKTPKEKQILNDSQLLEIVAQLTLVPLERPVITTINQATILNATKPFYKGVKDGDKLIIFPKSETAIIYSPDRKVIINSGPFVLGPGN